MLRSNLFAHIELTKFVDEIKRDAGHCRVSLLAQHAYFKLIPSKMFSEHLGKEWTEICLLVTKDGPDIDPNGRILTSAVKNTLLHMPEEKCVEIVNRITLLQQKVAAEF